MRQTLRSNFFTVTLGLLMFSVFNSCGQDYSDKTVLGETQARRAVKEVLTSNNYKPFYDTLIKDKELAIAIVEPILFKIYGKNNIVAQQPYECHLIDGYWYVSGTLPKNSVGGVFEIILDAKNANVLKLIHGK